MSAESLADRLDQRIDEAGPLPVSAYVEAALYDEAAGFYTAGGGHAGRRGDFLTAPEVGPLFGRVVAAAVDGWWWEAGRPDEFVVHEWGAGPGTLARAVLAAEPDVLTVGALHWCLIERSDEQRARHLEHDRLSSCATPPVEPPDLVLANELLDNLGFDVYERGAPEPDGAVVWHPVLVDRRDEDGRFVLVRGLAESGGEAGLDGLSGLAGLAEGTRVPVSAAARQWLVDVGVSDASGPRRVVVFDYGADTAELASREGGWLRTHAGHDGSADWLRSPGTCDITTDVAFDQLALVRRPDVDLRQDEWLRRHGIDELVEEGRRVWEERAGVGDLAALRARSRVTEAAALLDPGGMGAFRVLEWVR